MNIRQRIHQSRFLAWLLAAIAGAYLDLCFYTTRWTYKGVDQLKSDLADGPVLLLVWHGRSLFGPYHWPVKHGPVSTLYEASPIGRVSGALQRRRKMQPIEMSSDMSNLAASRVILRRVREGVSIGMTGDGPLGPNQILKDPPLEWARAMKRPAYTYGFATKRHKILGSWDKMMLPLPFTRGAAVYQRVEGEFVHKQDEGSRTRISDAMDSAMGEADRLVL